MHDVDVAGIRRALLDFFDGTARSLPWRGSGDPYAIWVSEVMAQQTRIDTVIPYYERWMARFPDITTLAGADTDDVLRHWQGLGYYGRARNLYAAARVVRERHGGEVPTSYDDLLDLPGVGEYTAGAVSSIAFGVPAPAVDGNVRRVLARLYDEARPSAAWLRRRAAALVPADRPGDFNQAVMELGARICTPRAPRCHACPLADHCDARAKGTELERPLPKPRKAVPAFDLATAIIRDRSGRVLLVRRGEAGLLAGMWAFPAAEPGPGENPTAAARRIAGALLPGARLSDAADVLDIGTVDHAFSHRRERYLCRLIRADPPGAGKPGDAREAGGADRAWVGADVSAYAMPRAQQRIHALVFNPAEEEGRPPGGGA
ncbi:MAG TPA: A/G-specific adenine glycosylase [Longimicrobiales bacterium]|nr:A/G-specific adenine glycosylase [Longimicrobiales bacterium]